VPDVRSAVRLLAEGMTTCARPRTTACMFALVLVLLPSAREDSLSLAQYYAIRKAHLKKRRVEHYTVMVRQVATRDKESFAAYFERLFPGEVTLRSCRSTGSGAIAVTPLNQLLNRMVK
jgi:hypothetical protein